MPVKKFGNISTISHLLANQITTLVSLSVWGRVVSWQFYHRSTPLNSIAPSLEIASHFETVNFIIAKQMNLKKSCFTTYLAI